MVVELEIVMVLEFVWICIQIFFHFMLETDSKQFNVIQGE